MAEIRDWYDTPLYYDIIFDADTLREADFLEVVYQEHGPGGRSRRLLEPACGSGRLVLEMARASGPNGMAGGQSRMLDFARQRFSEAGVKARLWEDWMQSFQVPARQGPFDLAHCLVSSFKYLLSEPDATACLQRVADSLRPGGLLVLGVHLTDYTRAEEEHE